MKMTPIISTGASAHMYSQLLEVVRSQIRLVGQDIKTNSDAITGADCDPAQNQSVSNDTPPRPIYQHQRVKTLILSARQILDQNSGIPGLVNPYLPKGPSLFRETFEDEPRAIFHQSSPLQSIAHLSFHSSNPRHKEASSYINRKSASVERVERKTLMPNPMSMPNSGFQALILCGPGIGLSTFTTVPNEYPKALIPIANKPMVWYPLDWCYRCGITNISIITPPSSKPALATALAQHPDLTCLPVPRPDLIAPADLDFTTPTAELLRLPEVQKAITSDFVLLPCDLVCTIPADAFIEQYTTSMSGIAGTSAIHGDEKNRRPFALGAEGSGRRGGMSIWYNTAGREESIKKEECDYMVTAKLEAQYDFKFQSVNLPSGGYLRKLVQTMPMSEAKEQAEEGKALKVRQSLLRKYGSVKTMTQYRDSHIYFFPHWVKDFAMYNEDFESISEDLVGTWTKTDWRKSSYRARHGADKIFKRQRRASSFANGTNSASSHKETPIEDEIDLLSLSSTQVSQYKPSTTKLQPVKVPSAQLASRVQASMEDSIISETPTEDSSALDDEDVMTEDGAGFDSATLPHLPPMLAYIMPSSPSAPLIRRVDTSQMLLNVSLLLAKQSNSETKIHPNSQPAAGLRLTIGPDVLVAQNTTLSLHNTLKSCCIGSNCSIGTGARLTNCVIFDGATIGEKAVLTGCIIGKRAKVGKGCKLTDCEVQDGHFVTDGTEAKGEKYLIGGLDENDEFDQQDIDLNSENEG